MNEILTDEAVEWTDADVVGYEGDEDWSEPESSSLTWNDEIVEQTHREVALRARRASLGRFFQIY